MPWTRLIITLLLVCTAGAGLLHLRTSADTRVFFGGDNPWFADLQQFEDVFGQDNNILLMLSQAPAAAKAGASGAGADLPAVLQPGLVAAQRSATALAWQLPRVLRVTSLANHPQVVTLADDSLELVPFLDWACPDTCRGDAPAALTQPLIRNRLASADGAVAGILMTFDLPLASTTDVQTIAAAVRALAARISSDYPGTEVRFTGGITMMEAFHLAAERDASVLVMAALGVMFMVLLVTLGELKLIGLTLATVVASVLVPMGLAGWTGMLLNSATAATPLVITTLVIATSVHLFLTFRNNVARQGMSPELAAEAAVAVNRKPIVLTAVTTGISFMAMTFADAPPLRELGALVALGILTGTLVTLLLMPALLPRLGQLRVLHSARWTGRLAAAAAEWPMRIMVPLVLVLVLFSGVGLQKLTVEDDFIEYFDTSFDFRRHAEFALAHFAGPNHLDLVLETDLDGGIFDPRHLVLLRQLDQWLRQQEHVASVVTLAHVVDDIAGHLTDLPLEQWQSDHVAQFVMAYELSMQPGQDLTDLMDVDRSASRVAVLLNGGKSRSIQQLEQGIYQWFASHTPADAPAGSEITVTGINIPTAHLALHNIQMMINSTVVSLLLIALLVAAWFRNLRMLPVALVAMALPVAMGFGLWGWLVGPVGLAGAVITAMTIGIIIDDAIHIIFRYHHARSHLGQNPADAMRHTLRTVGNAVLITSITLISGFSLLLLSGFQINSNLGLATAIIVACALVVDFFLVPPALAWLDAGYRGIRRSGLSARRPLAKSPR